MALVMPQAGQGRPVTARIKQRLRPFSSRCGPANLKIPARTLKAIKRPRGVARAAASTASSAAVRAAPGLCVFKTGEAADLARLLGRR